jgi:hypothetical protein
MFTTIRSLSPVKKWELIQNILMFFLRCFCYFLFISQNSELPMYIMYKKTSYIIDMENRVLSLLLLLVLLSSSSSSSSKACYMCTVPCSFNTTFLIVFKASHYIEPYALNLSSVITSVMFYLMWSQRHLERKLYVLGPSHINLLWYMHVCETVEVQGTEYRSERSYEDNACIEVFTVPASCCLQREGDTPTTFTVFCF